MLRVLVNSKRFVPTVGGPVIFGSLLALFLIFKLPVIRRQHKGGRVSLAWLRTALVGREKARVAAMFGSPRAVAAGESLVWYYPLDSDHRLAMAVSFDRERVRSVEFFNGPV